MNRFDVLGVVRQISDALEGAGVDYAVSGAIALAYWTAPRATLDVDIALDVAPTAVPALLETLTLAGCQFRDDALHRAQFGDFGARLDGIRIDFFLPVLSISVEAMQRRVRVTFADGNIWIFTAEDLAVFKLIFGRTKDFADLELLFAAQRGRLDLDYLERQVARIFDAADPRL
ncbi:MAG: hypothetical protein ACREXT_00825, partial [Gammaproteobacteria bacterium]